MPRKETAKKTIPTPATLSCCITTIGSPQEEPADFMQHIERQVVEKMMQALEEKLEAPLLRAGWKPNEDAKIPSRRPAFGKRTSTRPAPSQPQVLASGQLEIRTGEELPSLNISVRPDAILNKLYVPGVPLTLQLSSRSTRSNLSQTSQTAQVETQLYFGHWSQARITRGSDAYTVPYPFRSGRHSKRPDQSPVIVNMEVYIRATPQVSADLLSRIDWHQIGEGLHHSKLSIT